MLAYGSRRMADAIRLLRQISFFDFILFFTLFSNKFFIPSLHLAGSAFSSSLPAICFSFVFFFETLSQNLTFLLFCVILYIKR